MGGWKMDNILWLPFDYRPTCSVDQNNILALGHASGRGIALGQPARLIMASLRRSHYESLIDRRDVYNARHKLRTEQLVGRSPIQILKDQLTEKG